jgi:pyridoxamine-phosphate oxidase
MSEPNLPPFIEKNLSLNPIKQFQRWLDEAVGAKIPQAESMTLATATKKGVPSARMVLLKHVDAKGFVFYTNYKSQKGKELAENPHASLVFYWEELHRQVRIDGTVSEVSPEESDAYFQTGPRESQISAHASAQSEVIGGIILRKCCLVFIEDRGRNTTGNSLDDFFCLGHGAADSAV